MKYLAEQDQWHARGLMHAQAVVMGDYESNGKRKLYPDGVQIEHTGIIQIPDDVADRVVKNSRIKLMTADEYAQHVTSESLINSLKPLPAEGEAVEKDQVYNYNGEALVAYQSHIRTRHDPLATASLFGRAKSSADAWTQPLGAHDAYKIGSIVTHKGKTWVNTGSNANVWEPSVFGWTERR